MMSAAAADDEGPELEPSRTSDDLPESRGSAEVAPWTTDLETLAKRMKAVRQDYELTQRFEALSAAWVLVFDADTDDEAVYSMQIGDDEDAHAVLAFEEESDAKRYAISLRDEPNTGTASVQALDFEALVVTSRDADFAVAVVFQGDLGASPKVDEHEVPIFASDAAAALSMSVTMVPDEVFAGKSASDYVDPAEDPIWVLVHDAGTADAQYFSMMLNGSDSVVCFRDEDSASRCGDALRTTGTLRAPETQEVLLEDLLNSISEECDVCLVDEVSRP